MRQRIIVGSRNKAPAGHDAVAYAPLGHALKYPTAPEAGLAQDRGLRAVPRSVHPNADDARAEHSPRAEPPSTLHAVATLSIPKHDASLGCLDRPPTDGLIPDQGDQYDVMDAS